MHTVMWDSETVPGQYARVFVESVNKITSPYLQNTLLKKDFNVYYNYKLILSVNFP